MKKTRTSNWFVNPTTKRDVTINTILWFVCMGVFVFSLTNVFSEDFFQRKYLVIYMMMIFSTTIVVRNIMKYIKSKQQPA